MLRENKVIYSLFLVLILSGCAANPYAKYYNDFINGADLTKIESVKLSDRDPVILQGNDPVADRIRMIELGYLAIGSSSFNSGERSKSELIDFAKSIRAEKVILYTNYSHTNSGVMPLEVPRIDSYSTTFSGNTYNFNAGNVNFSGAASTTYIGSETIYIPYNEHRYDYLAVYMVKLDLAKIDFGADVMPLTPAAKEKIGSNKGIVVTAVVENTPAYDADILRGDIITHIGGLRVNNMEDYFKIKRKVRGQTVNVAIIRNGLVIDKMVSFKEVVFKNLKQNSNEVARVRGA